MLKGHTLMHQNQKEDGDGLMFSQYCGGKATVLCNKAGTSIQKRASGKIIP